jgi:hypothetical protein
VCHQQLATADGEGDGPRHVVDEGDTDDDDDDVGDANGDTDGDALGDALGDGDAVGGSVATGLSMPLWPNSSATTKIRPNTATIKATHTRETGSST